MAGSRNRFIKRKPAKKKVVKPARSRVENRRSSASKKKTIPASKRPADMRKGVVYGDAGRPFKGPGGDPKGTGKGQAQQAPPAPKLPPRKKPAAAKPAPKPAAKPAPKAPAKKAPAAKKPAAPKPKAKATPKRKPRTWLKDNYKPGAKGIKSSRLSKALSSLKVRDYKKKK